MSTFRSCALREQLLPPTFSLKERDLSHHLGLRRAVGLTPLPPFHPPTPAAKTRRFPKSEHPIVRPLRACNPTRTIPVSSPTPFKPLAQHPLLPLAQPRLPPCIRHLLEHLGLRGIRMDRRSDCAQSP